MLKKLTKEILPYYDSVGVVSDMLESNNGHDMRFLEHLLSFTDYQCREEAEKRGYHEIGVGQRGSIDIANLLHLVEIYSRLVGIYTSNDSISTKVSDDKVFHYYEKLLCLLNPWLIQIHLNSDVSNRSNVLNDSEKNFLFLKLCFAERGMASVAINRKQFDVAEDHCKRNLNYSKKFGIEGKIKTTSIFRALKLYVHLRGRQGDDTYLRRRGV
jgi:hypothetical protein